MALDAARLADADFGGLVDAVRAAAATAAAPAAGRFAHVDREALQRIVDARLAGAEAPQAARSLLAEAARGVVYMARRGLFHYLRIQWRDGLFRFLLDAPTAVDLERVVVVPGPRVAFAQTDYNRHFTVREIVRDSERGFYNLVHASGLAHLEHYFRVMFFASRLEARFDAELLEGEAYEMRCRVAEITGPLVDVEVAGRVARALRAASLAPDLPCRKAIDCFELGRCVPGALGSRSPRLFSLAGPAGTLALYRTSEVDGHAPCFPSVERLRLVHHRGGPEGGLRLCSFQLGLGGYGRLRSLELSASPDACAPWLRRLGRGDAARLAPGGRAGADDRALYGLCDALRRGGGASPLPALEDPVSYTHLTLPTKA
mgnify:CR=1 FL=1